jgi:hypothetical protein
MPTRRTSDGAQESSRGTPFHRAQGSPLEVAASPCRAPRPSAFTEPPRTHPRTRLQVWRRVRTVAVGSWKRLNVPQGVEQTDGVDRRG